LPTVAASGLPGYRAEALYGVWAPAGTPAAILGLLNRNIVAVLGNADVKEKFLSAGTEIVGSSAAAFAAMARMGKVINDANIKGGAD
jgi:tripartite-type tricarboxylate transporter receptor subunit TctC